MKTIPLTQGYVAVVDDVDYDKVSVHNWCAKIDKKNVYAHRILAGQNGAWTSQTMHRFILGLSDPKVKVDHWDNDGLNNRRANLRMSTNQQNCFNARIKPGRYKGVGWHARCKKWRATICFNGNRISLGLFAVPEDAAKAYNSAALTYFGEFAKLNQIEEG